MSKLNTLYADYVKEGLENPTDMSLILESIDKIMKEEKFEEAQKLYLIEILLQRNTTEYIHDLKKKINKLKRNTESLEKQLKEIKDKKEKDKKIEAEKLNPNEVVVKNKPTSTSAPSTPKKKFVVVRKTPTKTITI